MAIWTRLFALMGGGAVAAAAAKGAEPTVELVAQDAFKVNPFRVLDPGTLGVLIAQALIESKDATDQAARSGFDANKLNAYVQLALKAPPVAEVLELWRRGEFGPPDPSSPPALVTHALSKAQIEPQYHGAILELFHVRLSASDVAMAIQQGHLPNPGILPDVAASVPAIGGQVEAEAPDGAPPSHVPLTQIDLDPLLEALAHGIDVDRLRVLANLAGLPPGADTLLQMWNRELIDEATVDAGIREGHTKTKWASAFKRMRWAVLGAAEYASAHLRGWITQEEMYRGGKLTGHTKAQMDLLYLNRGRPLAPVQAYAAWARGSPGPVGAGYERGTHPFDEEDFLRALQQSDIRTEYGPTLWANRHAYPPLFQLGRLAQAKALPEERVRTILKYERYEEQDIDAFVAFWYGDGGAGATKDPLAKKAQSQLWTALHKAYVDFAVDEGTAANTLTILGAADPSVVLGLWDRERLLVRTELTTTQIKKAYVQDVLSEAEATTKLEQLGMTAADIHTLLHS